MQKEYVIQFHKAINKYFVTLFLIAGASIVKHLTRQYPLVIEKNIGLVLCPSTASYISFLDRCTLTYKPARTILKICQNLFKRDKTLNLVPRDYYSGLFKTFDLNLHTTSAEHDLLLRMSLYFLVY